MGGGQVDERHILFHNSLGSWRSNDPIRLASRRVLRNFDLAGAPLGLQCPYTIEVAYHKSFATLAARFLSRTESWRLGEYY